MFKMIVAASANGNGITFAVQDRYPVAGVHAGTDAANGNIDKFPKLFDMRPIAPPGTKEKLVVFPASKGVIGPIASSQRTVGRRER
jgi:hypothetical protein